MLKDSNIIEISNVDYNGPHTITTSGPIGKNIQITVPSEKLTETKPIN